LPAAATCKNGWKAVWWIRIAPISRLLKKALRLDHRDDLATVLAVNAATITNNLWVTSAKKHD
jgi:hypothetical protein